MKPCAMLVGALATLALASAAFAQPAPASPPSPAALEQARHLIKTMHADRMPGQMISAMEKSFSSSMFKNLTPDGQADANAPLEEIRAIMPRLIDAMATIYATDFTEQELSDMDRFYASPTGQSMLAKMPLVAQQLMPIALAEMPGLMGRDFERLCERSHCTAEQRAEFAKTLDAVLEAMKPKSAAQPG